MHRAHQMFFLAVFLVPLLTAQSGAQTHSRLWGEHGELFDPHGRLPDFSYAGYAFGDRPIPSPDPVVSVDDFGASGDDALDDTRAFQDAINAIESGVISIPEGKYHISDIIWIKKPGIILRGSGSGKTVIRITTNLEDVRPNMRATTSGRPTSGYSWSGGFFWVKGRVASTEAVRITSPAAHGDREVAMQDPAGFTPGQLVLIEQTDNADKSLLDHLYGGDPGDTRKLTGDLTPMMVARVVDVTAQSVVLNRPLRWDVRPEWSPTLRLFEPSVHGVGIEAMTIAFAPEPYGGHFSERGRNPLAFNTVSDCWVRDVVVQNCDSAVFFTGFQGTIDGLRVESSRDPDRGLRGHHGVILGLDNLLTNFSFETRFIHDITMTRLSAGNVVKNGSGVSLSLDHHKRANHANLYCNLDAGDGGDLWRSGGGASLGKNAGAWTTLWGIRTARPVNWPAESFGPDLMNMIGLHTDGPGTIGPDARWFEVIDPDLLEPRDLHAAQRARRGAPGG